jgi:hypothetical protein
MVHPNQGDAGLAVLRHEVQCTLEPPDRLVEPPDLRQRLPADRQGDGVVRKLGEMGAHDRLHLSMSSVAHGLVGLRERGDVA